MAKKRKISDEKLKIMYKLCKQEVPSKFIALQLGISEGSVNYHLAGKRTGKRSAGRYAWQDKLIDDTLREGKHINNKKLK